jgi:PAS domain S-box-containing protein
MSEQPKSTERSLSILQQVYLLVAIVVLTVGLSAGIIRWNEDRLGEIEDRTSAYHESTIRHLDRVEKEIFFIQKTAPALHVSHLAQHERTGVYEHDESEAALSDLTASVKQIEASFADVVEIQARFGGLDFRQTVARAELLARRIQDDYETSLRTTLLEDELYRRVARDLDAFLVAVKRLQGLHRISHGKSKASLIAQRQRNGLILVGLVAVALGLGGVTVFRLLQLIRRGLTQHARTETALRESEARYARAVTGANDGIWDWNIQTGELYFSPRWEEIVGYTPSEIEPVVQSFVDLVHPDDREIQAVAERNHRECRAPYDIEIRLRHRNGGYVWVRDRGQAVWSADGTPLRMAGSITDITKQKRAQAALRDSEARLANAQRIARIGNWDWNIVTGELHWSDQIYRIFGLKPQEFGATYEAFLQSVHPDDRELVQAAVNRAFDEREPYAIDHRIVLPDGEERIVHEQGEVTFDASGKPLRMTGTVQDITERMRTDQINTRLGRIVEDSVNEIYVFDGDTLRFIQVNRGARENLGYSAEELRELSPLDLKPEYTAEAFAELVRPLRDGSKRQITFNTIHRRKDGTTYDVEGAAPKRRTLSGRGRGSAGDDQPPQTRRHPDLRQQRLLPLPRQERRGVARQIRLRGHGTRGFGTARGALCRLDPGGSGWRVRDPVHRARRR